MLAHITYLSDESMYNKFGRNLQDSPSYSFAFKRDFAVESYLEYQGRRFTERFDANSYLYITRATDYFDISAKAGGDLAKALEPAKCHFLVVSFSSDWLFPRFSIRGTGQGFAEKTSVRFHTAKSNRAMDMTLSCWKLIL